MYNLYHNKEQCVIELRKVRSKERQLQAHYTHEPSRFNDCYYICVNRKPLKELAQQLKEGWIIEAKDRLEKTENIKF